MSEIFLIREKHFATGQNYNVKCKSHVSISFKEMTGFNEIQREYHLMYNECTYNYYSYL